jgi:aspartate carbamoyltransferase catalytic subunit
MLKIFLPEFFRERIDKMDLNFSNRDIISITDFTREEILYLCQKAKTMYDLEKSGQRYKLAKELQNRSMAYLFYEPSTRTRTSHVTAMRELGGMSDGFSGTEGTAVTKKETIRDTIMMVCANRFDVIVMRHPLDGSVQWAADVSSIPVINGGDGKNEHPTQALLDVFTIYLLNDESLDDLNVGLGGDLFHGRTIRSLSLALSHFENVTIRWAAEDFLGMPDDLIPLLESRGVTVVREENVEDVMSKAQFYYMTRPQLERMKGISQEDIIKMMQKYRIDLAKVKNFNVKLMHPLPVNSEVAEIDYRVFFDKCQAFFQQAENGIILRKALLYEMLKHDGYIQFDGQLNPVLERGNNCLRRKSKGDDKEEKKFIDNIANGVVVDHLRPGSEQKIVADLNLINRGTRIIPANLPNAGKSLLKTDLFEFNERELKSIAEISPEPTINYIRDDKVIAKFVYLLCRNSNCVTRALNEDVPPQFYKDDDEGARCRYCRKPYSIITKKATEEEKQSFIDSLPAGIDPV